MPSKVYLSIRKCDGCSVICMPQYFNVTVGSNELVKNLKF